MRGRSWMLVACALAGCGRSNFDEIGPTDALTPVAEPPRFLSGSRLRAVAYTTPQGSSLSYWHDNLLDLDCRVTENRGGATRCLPDNTLVAYQDAGCTQPLIHVYGPGAMPGCNQPPRLAWDQATGTGYELGAAWMAPVYTGLPGSCMLRTDPNAALFFERGAVITDDRFAVLTPVIRRGNQRLGYIQLVSEDGAEQRAMDLFDTATGQRCSLLVMETGEYRCVPDLAVSNVLYRDATCTEPLVVVAAGAPYAFTQQVGLCHNNTRIRAVGPVYTGPTFAFGASGSCFAFTPADGEVHEVGADAPLDDFEPLMEALEPFDSRLQRRVSQTADGIVQPQFYNAWFDTQRGQYCRDLVEETSGALVCAPEWSSSFLFYWNASGCNGGLTPGNPACRPESGSIYFITGVTPSHTCEGLKVQVQAFENPAATAVWERSETGTCSGSTQPMFTSTRIIDGSELPPMQRTRE